MTPICEVEGCSCSVFAKRMCTKHYTRMRRYGDLGRGRVPRSTFEDAFWSMVGKSGDCWIWKGHTINGYGSFRGKRAHRIAYELLVGPIPEGMDVDHRCHNRACVRPGKQHCGPMTPRENRGDRERIKTHCPQGHPYDKKNTLIKKGTNWRECRKCAAIRAQRNRDRLAKPA